MSKYLADDETVIFYFKTKTNEFKPPVDSQISQKSCDQRRNDVFQSILSCPSLPLTQEDLSSVADTLEEVSETPEIREITVRKRPRKTKSKNKLSLSKGNISNFRSFFPNFNYLLNDKFDRPIDAQLVESLIEIMRPIYLKKNILLLDCFDVSRLYALYSLKDFNELVDYFDSLKGYTDTTINQVSAIVYSTTSLANQNSLVLDYHVLKDQNGRVDYSLGHFIFFNFNFDSSTITIIDTLNNNTVDSPYFSNEQIKKMGLCLLKAGSSEERKVKNSYYKKTSYTQQSTECGILALLNLILTYDNNIDFLSAYTLTNYNSDITSFRTILAEIFVTNNIPLYKLKINWKS